MRSWLSLVLVLAACGTDSMPRGSEDEGEPLPVDTEQCDESYLDYQTFGEPFMLDWCRGCHSSAVPATMRQKAPIDVNFDTLEQVQHWGERIAMRAASTSPTMPPAGGPGSDERALLAEWLACGMR